MGEPMLHCVACHRRFGSGERRTLIHGNQYCMDCAPSVRAAYQAGSNMNHLAMERLDAKRRLNRLRWEAERKIAGLEAKQWGPGRITRAWDRSAPIMSADGCVACGKTGPTRTLICGDCAAKYPGLPWQPIRVDTTPKTLWSPTAVRGLRVWSISHRGVLQGHGGFNWGPGTNEARHEGQDPKEHGLIPRSGCMCGFYAREPSRFMERHMPRFHVRNAVGEVAMWGRVIEHDYGYRAQYARIERVLLTEYNEHVVARYGADRVWVLTEEQWRRGDTSALIRVMFADMLPPEATDE